LELELTVYGGVISGRRSIHSLWFEGLSEVKLFLRVTDFLSVLLIICTATNDLLFDVLEARLLLLFLAMGE
jgi:hypothetical protein